MVQIRCENSASYKQRKKRWENKQRSKLRMAIFVDSMYKDAKITYRIQEINKEYLWKKLRNGWERARSVTQQRGMADVGSVNRCVRRWRQWDEEWRWGSSVSVLLKFNDKLKEPLKTASKGALSCVWFWLWDHKCKGIYENSMSFEFWKLKTAKMCFQFP